LVIVKVPPPEVVEGGLAVAGQRLGQGAPSFPAGDLQQRLCRVEAYAQHRAR